MRGLTRRTLLPKRRARPLSTVTERSQEVSNPNLDAVNNSTPVPTIIISPSSPKKRDAIAAPREVETPTKPRKASDADCAIESDSEMEMLRVKRVPSQRKVIKKPLAARTPVMKLKFRALKKKAFSTKETTKKEDEKEEKVAESAKDTAVDEVKDEAPVPDTTIPMSFTEDSKLFVPPPQLRESYLSVPRRERHTQITDEFDLLGYAARSARKKGVALFDHQGMPYAPAATAAEQAEVKTYLDREEREAKKEAAFMKLKLEEMREAEGQMAAVIFAHKFDVEQEEEIDSFWRNLNVHPVW
jgi:hypothetical protein